MNRRWLFGAWAFLGAPAAALLVGYSEVALYAIRPKSLAFLSVVALLPGACIGLGLLVLLSLVKPRWPLRVIVAAAYGSAMYILAEMFANPVLVTYAALAAMPQ
jgi:hypothetical protein